MSQCTFSVYLTSQLLGTFLSLPTLNFLPPGWDCQPCLCYFLWSINALCSSLSWMPVLPSGLSLIPTHLLSSEPSLYLALKWFHLILYPVLLSCDVELSLVWRLLWERRWMSLFLKTLGPLYKWGSGMHPSEGCVQHLVYGCQCLSGQRYWDGRKVQRCWYETI